VLRLSGLHLDGFPLAALAAYGLLRVLEERGIEAGLAFEAPRARPVALLDVRMRERDLLDHLVAHVFSLDLGARGVPAGGGKIPSLSTLWKEEKLPRNPFTQAYLAPLPPRGRSKGPRLVTTPFDTTKGQQGFLKALATVVKQLREDRDRTREAFRKVLCEDVRLLPGDRLFGEVPRLGWHPSQFRRTADQARIANKERPIETIRLNPAALLLAWEAIPYFPFVPSAREPLPLGFAREGGRYRLFLPTPGTPVGPRMLRALVALAPGLGGRTPDLGVWTSLRIGSKSSKDDYPCFLEAEPVVPLGAGRPPRTPSGGRNPEGFA